MDTNAGVTLLGAAIAACAALIVAFRKQALAQCKVVTGPRMILIGILTGLGIGLLIVVLIPDLRVRIMVGIIWVSFLAAAILFFTSASQSN
jgi:hypothetical protein